MTKNYEKITITTDYITLGQFLKLVDVITNGGEAKFFIAENEILVNGEDCKMRGKKLREGDKLVINNSLFFEITKWLLKKLNLRIFETTLT